VKERPETVRPVKDRPVKIKYLLTPALLFRAFFYGFLMKRGNFADKGKAEKEKYINIEQNGASC